jgi:hypothetical protein
LLPTAAVAFSVTASKPFVEPEDAERGLILTLAPNEIKHTPPSLSAYEDVESYPFRLRVRRASARRAARGGDGREA